MKRDKPIVGQILVAKSINNAARRYEDNDPKLLSDVVVVKVGRKYFTVSPIDYADDKDSWCWTQHHLSNWREKTDYSASSELYTHRQEVEDMMKKRKICDMLSSRFHYGEMPDLTLEQYQTIEGWLTKKA